MVPRYLPLQGSRTTALLQFCVVCSLGWTTVQGFQIQLNTRQAPKIFLPQRVLVSSPLGSSEKVVDVEFERIPDPEEDLKKKKKKQKKNKKKSKKGFARDEEESSTGKSLFDLSLEAGDPQWKEARIPFVDTARQSVIDGTLAFVIDLEGVQYGIAIPCDKAAAITVEEPDGTVTNIPPEAQDDNQELMEIMAAQLVEHVGEDLSLKRTPRVLTIQGDLDKYTKNWQEDILPNPHQPNEFLFDDDDDEDDDDDQWFHDFMKKELGEEEYEKTMAEPTTAEDLGDELMELFDIPGFGARSDDTKGVEELFQSLETEEDPMKVALDNLGGHPLDHDGAALKLISYHMKNGKSYSLVQLLKPYTLVGRLAKDTEGLQFELLTPEEEKMVLPKLEEACRKDLEKATGMDLSP